MRDEKNHPLTLSFGHLVRVSGFKRQGRGISARIKDFSLAPASYDSRGAQPTETRPTIDSKTRNPEPGTRNPEPGTRNPDSTSALQPFQQRCAGNPAGSAQ